MNNILLLGATFGTGNLGVGALTAGALTVVSKRYPQAAISLLDYGHAPAVSVMQVDGKTVTVPLVNLRFSWKVLLANNIAALLVLSLATRVFGTGARDWLVRRNRWLRAVAQADAAVAVSGGDSFSDIYGLGRFFYVTLPQLLVVSLGVRLIMLPQTIGPFKGGVARRIAAYLVRKAAIVYSRDEAGLAEIHKLLAPGARDGKARFCHDMGFVVEPHAPRQMDLGGLEARGRAAGRPLVGLNVSGLLLAGGYNRSNMFGLQLDYGELIDGLVAHLIDVKGADVLLVPHVFSDDMESDTAAARAVHERLRERYGAHLFRAKGGYDQNEIKHVIGLCDFFVGSRMHACIAALSQGIPAVGVAYSDKFAGVFDSVGAGSMVIDPRRLSAPQVIAAIADAFDARAATAERLRRTMPQVKAGVLAMLDEIE